MSLSRRAYRSAAPYMKTAERVYDSLRVWLDGEIWECEIKRIIDRDVPFYFVKLSRAL